VTLESLGFNLNAAVGDFLNPFYNKVGIEYFKDLGMDNRKGERTPRYAAPVALEADVQVPQPALLEKTNKVNDSQVVRQFWVNAEILPNSRVDNIGGDLIGYDGAMWYVISHPDDFRQVGWMSVLAVKTLEPRPEIGP
jgi:hypothetical protein